MIKAYKGFTVSHAEHFMHDAAYAVYDSVGAMLRYYLLSNKIIGPAEISRQARYFFNDSTHDAQYLCDDIHL